MKRSFLAAIAVIGAFAVIVQAAEVYASDYQGIEKQGSVFQKLSDMMTGKYEVAKGKTVKDVNVVQCMADQVKDIKAAPLK